MGKRTKKIAFFVPSMRGGGAERVTLNLVKQLDLRGYDIDVLLAQTEGPYLSEIPDSVRIIDLAAARVLMSLPRLISYLQQEQPVAMLSVMNHTNIVALAAKQLARGKTRIVVSEHNTLSSMAQNSAKLKWKLLSFLMRCCYPWADSVVAVSQGVADDLSRSIGLSLKRIQVIYNPVITPELRIKASQPLSDDSIRHRFLPGQPPVIMAVGRMTPQKDFGTLIQAFSQLSSPAHLLILGEGPERPQLEALVKSLNLEDRVSLPGFVDNPYAYMTHSALFVLSSRWEGLPTALIEALYCGTPLVATDCPSGPKEILQEGKYGTLVPVGDVSAMAQAMSRALSKSLSKSMPEQAKANHPGGSAGVVAPHAAFALETVTEQYLHALIGDSL